MLNRIFEFFRKRNVETHVSDTPMPGQVWYLKPKHKEPWPSGFDYYPCRIHDVKDGWVRYGMGASRGSIFEDERSPIDVFLMYYTNKKEDFKPV